MKANLKNTLIVFFSLFLAVSYGQSQEKKETSKAKINEIKIRPLGLLFNSIGIGFEVQTGQNTSFEANTIYSWKGISTAFFTNSSFNGDETSTFGANFNYRYYINDSQQTLDRFYAGAYTNLVSQGISKFSSSGSGNTTKSREATISLGFIGGYKLISKDGKITFDFNAGIGRKLLNPNDGLGLDGISSVMVGYRF